MAKNRNKRGYIGSGSGSFPNGHQGQGVQTPTPGLIFVHPTGLIGSAIHPSINVRGDSDLWCKRGIEVFTPNADYNISCLQLLNVNSAISTYWAPGNGQKFTPKRWNISLITYAPKPFKFYPFIWKTRAAGTDRSQSFYNTNAFVKDAIQAFIGNEDNVIEVFEPITSDQVHIDPDSGNLMFGTFRPVDIEVLKWALKATKNIENPDVDEMPEYRLGLAFVGVANGLLYSVEHFQEIQGTLADRSMGL